MRLIRYNVATTLDGYIASPGGNTSWIIDDPSIDFPALYAKFSTFVMGRKTYNTMLSFGAQNPLKDMSRESVVVISKTMKQEDHENITVMSDGFVEFMGGLREGEGKDVWFMGGSELVGVLFKAGILDRVEVAVMPVVIGNGVKMVDFGIRYGDSQGWKLKLENVERKESGILMLEYWVCTSEFSIE